MDSTPIIAIVPENKSNIYDGGGGDIMTGYLTATLHRKQNLKYKTCGKGKINRPFHCNIILAQKNIQDKHVKS